MLRLIPT